MFICPICGLKLNNLGNKYICDTKHSFDVSRQGYINLLPVSGKKSKAPGDNEIMSGARRAFLNSGAYAPLRDMILNTLKENGVKSLVDSGCSEGYYTKSMAEGVESVYAFDISKSAVKTAAAEDKKTKYFVASAFSIPLKNNSFDCVTKIFAPDSPKEFSRLLKKEGFLLEVIPGVYHLIELKQKLYENAYLNKIEDGKKEGFVLASEESLTYKFTPKSDERQNLFMMTPYYYKTSPQKRQTLLLEEEFPVTADFIVRKYKREGV